MSNQQSVIVIQNREQYEQLLKEKNPIILYLSSQTCSVCHAVFPKLMGLVKDYPITVAKINVDEYIEIAGQNLFLQYLRF